MFYHFILMADTTFTDCRFFHKLNRDKESSCYAENSSMGYVTCSHLTLGSVSPPKTQTTFSPHGDILMAAKHKSVPSHMSPSDGFGDGGGVGVLVWLPAFSGCVRKRAAGAGFSFLSPSPLTVTTESFILH